MIISLIGMPGSGKTTVAKLLAEELKDFSLTDTDEKIVEKEQRTINDIFAKDGEEYFRTVETEVLKNTLNGDNLIVSTGGGIILKEENRLLLKDKSLVVYLKTSPEELFERVKNNKDRPLLNFDDVRQKIDDLYSKRKDLYENAAQITADTENKPPSETVKEITVKINGKR